jgi:hypothetical protein
MKVWTDKQTELNIYIDRLVMLASQTVNLRQESGLWQGVATGHGLPKVL